MRALLMLFAVCLTAVSAAAGPGLGLFADTGQSSCIVPGDGTGVVRVHMFHTGDQLSTAVQFAIYPPACWPGATFLGDVLAEPWLSIGATNGSFGLSIAYGECRQTPVYLGYAEYSGVPAAHCCQIQVSKPADIPDARLWVEGASAIDVDCEFNMREASTRSVILNANASCDCGHALATEPSTWGRIKSLYR